MRILVCGSRTFDDSFIVERVLYGCISGAETTVTIVEGGASGADRLANITATIYAIPHEQYPADWASHDKTGPVPCNCAPDRDRCRAAGPRRNQRMLDEGKPDVVVAFVDKPLAESRGTADMVRRARAAELPVYVIEALRKD